MGKDYLIDTCLNRQDNYEKIFRRVKFFFLRKNIENIKRGMKMEYNIIYINTSNNLKEIINKHIANIVFEQNE